MFQSNNKWLVVIVERHTLWNMWCIDIIENSVREEVDIEILDLSAFRLLRYQKNSRYLLSKLYRKNRIENILRRVAKQHDTKIITPSILERIKSSKRDFHRENYVSFLNGLDSQYFEEMGIRIISEAQIAPRKLIHAIRVYNKVTEIVMRTINERGITKVIVPGGRTLIPNAVIAGSQNLGTPCSILEQITSKSTRYFEYPLDFRQNRDSLQREIDETWAKGGSSKFEVARNHLENKLRGDQLGFNFTKTFDSTLDILNPEAKKLAVIFVSSGFEMVPTEVEKNSTQLGSDHQKEIVRTFSKIALEHGFSVVLRGHPPSAGFEKMYAAEDRGWADLCNEIGIVHLPSFSKFDSYKLMEQSDVNVVYASTAGIDSILLGANTLVLGNTDWSHLVPELCAFDEQSIRNRFSSFERIVDVKRIYPYAFFMECGGIKMSDVEYTSLGKLHFKGKEIGAPRFKFLEVIFKR
jgi:hypothetical protein